MIRVGSQRHSKKLQNLKRIYHETKFGFYAFVENEGPTGDYVQYMSIDLIELSFSNSETGL
jgi:hypothetical protein